MEALLEVPFFNRVEMHPRHQEGCTPPLEKTRKLKKRLVKCLAPPKEKTKSRSQREFVRAGAATEVDASDDDAESADGPQAAMQPQLELPAQSEQTVAPEPEPERAGFLAEIR